VLKVPKIDMHVHLEGAICPYRYPNRKSAIASCCGDMPSMYGHLTRIWMKHLSYFDGYDSYLNAVMMFGEECAKTGVMYAEPSISPISRMSAGVPVREIYRALKDGVAYVKEHFGIELRFTIEFYRGADLATVMQMLEASEPFAGDVIVALGASGWEDRALLQEYARVFERGRLLGLAIVPHAGELAGASSVLDVLDIFPTRLKHGALAVDDESVMGRLIRDGISLDMSILSNLRLGVTTELATHPFRTLASRGIVCALGTDDPAILGIDITAEYVCAAMLGQSPRISSLHGLLSCSLTGANHARLAKVISTYDWAECEEALAGISANFFW
jgi:aminodeoxyfutalosine deaminase